MLKCNTMWSWIHLVVSVYYLEDRPKTMTALTGMLLSLCTTSNFCASIYQILSTKLISLRLNRKRSYATTFFIKIGPWSGPGLALAPRPRLALVLGLGPGLGPWPLALAHGPGSGLALGAFRSRVQATLAEDARW